MRAARDEALVEGTQLVSEGLCRALGGNRVTGRRRELSDQGGCPLRDRDRVACVASIDMQHHRVKSAREEGALNDLIRQLGNDAANGRAAPRRQRRGAEGVQREGFHGASELENTPGRRQGCRVFPRDFFGDAAGERKLHGPCSASAGVHRGS
jgi:hypothetical protein